MTFDDIMLAMAERAAQSPYDWQREAYWPDQGEPHTDAVRYEHTEMIGTRYCDGRQLKLNVWVEALEQPRGKEYRIEFAVTTFVGAGTELLCGDNYSNTDHYYTKDREDAFTVAERIVAGVQTTC